MKHQISVLTLAISTLLPLETAFGLEVPRLSKRVTDLAGMVEPTVESRVEAQLRAHEAATTDQIAVLTIPSLEGEVIEEYALKVAEQWALGQKGKDNGALILVARCLLYTSPSPRDLAVSRMPSSA